MNPEKRLAHIVAYYLSRFDKQALSSLGYRTDREAFEQTASRLGVKPNYMKFRRDEFDVEHPHRMGWHKRKKSASIISILDTFAEWNFAAMDSIVKQILSGTAAGTVPEDLEKVLEALDAPASNTGRAFYPSRSLTGRKAEEAFNNWFVQNPVYFGAGALLTDRRDQGCGYDFRVILPDGRELPIEVKALSADHNGILLTSKEWDTAREMGRDYILALLSSLDTSPVAKFIVDPYASLSPKRNLQTVLRLSWTLTAREIAERLRAQPK